jgi:glycosyltransferase involved in cell wall biosynthesis
MDSPRVTLGFTTYNVERYLPQAFDAVLAQDFPDFEVVVCDNGSTDRTWEICQRYAATDDRFRVHQNPRNLGEAGNFAQVVSLARGEFFRLTAHDDLIAPSLVGRCVAALDAAGPAAVLAYPRAVLIDAEGTEIGPLDYPGDLRIRSPWRRTARMGRVVNHGCNEVFGLVRTEVLRRTKLLVPIASGDVALLAELVARGQFVQLPDGWGRALARPDHHRGQPGDAGQ